MAATSPVRPAVAPMPRGTAIAPARVAALYAKVRDAERERVRVLGYDDGRGDRSAARRRAAGAGDVNAGPSWTRTTETEE